MVLSNTLLSALFLSENHNGTPSAPDMESQQIHTGNLHCFYVDRVCASAFSQAVPKEATLFLDLCVQRMLAII